MTQQPSSTIPSVTDDCTAFLEEPYEAITESDVVLDEAAWRTLLIQIDREEDTG